MLEGLSEWVALALVVIVAVTLMFAAANSFEELERSQRQQEGDDHVNDVH